MKFPFGIIDVTLAAASALRAAGVHLHDLLERHTRGDGGDSLHEEPAYNQGEQIVSSYNLPLLDVSIYVVTEGDRRTTWIGFFEEYSEWAARGANKVGTV